MSDPKAAGPDAASPGNVEGNKQLDTVLVWFRRDLRVADNPALTAALHAARTVVCFCAFMPHKSVVAGLLFSLHSEAELRERSLALDLFIGPMPDSSAPDLWTCISIRLLKQSAASYAPFVRGRLM